MTSEPDDDAAPLEPVKDTWRWKGDGAAWIATYELPGGDAAAINGSCAGVLAGALADLAPLVRMHAGKLITDDGPTRLAWDPDEPNARFRERVLATIRAQPLVLMQVQADVDLRAWFRTADADEPVLAWLRQPAQELVLSVDEGGMRASITFELPNTLFSAFTYPYADQPNPLHPRNQPLLEEALRRFGARSVDELEVTGELPGKRAYGFSADPDDY